MKRPVILPETVRDADLLYIGDAASAYVHVPFCVHRCGYCDFTLIAGRTELIGSYLSTLAMELQRLQTPRRVDTLFLGGGTPTLLRPTQLAELFKLLARWLPLSDNGELSIEANPDGFTDEHLRVLCDAGVNRVSLGVQSFVPEELATLERHHSPDEAMRVVRQVAEKIPNVSIDLIFAVPEQTPASWESSVRQALTLPLTHVSTYGLTFENGTAFDRRRKSGDLIAPDDDVHREMYETAIEQLSAAGFAQYEISSFARPGFECGHNTAYWNGDNYHAFGPGAARHYDGLRVTSSRSVLRWLRETAAGRPSVEEAERLADDERMREAIFLGLRRTRGVLKNEFKNRWGVDIHDLAAEAIDCNTERGWLIDDGDAIRLTHDGRFFADSVATDFL